MKTISHANNHVSAGSSRRGGVLAAAISVVATGSAITLAALSLSYAARSNVSHAAPLAARTEPASAAEVSALLHRLGLSPSHLAAAGVSAEQTTALVSNLRGYLENNIDGLRSADSSYAAANSVVLALEQVVRAGTSTSQQRQSLETARTQRASYAATRQTLLNSALYAATAALDSGVVQSLTRAQTNNSGGWGVGTTSTDMPLPFAFADRPEEEWIHLRDALSNQRIHVRDGTEPDAGALATIAEASAASAVSSASANLQANLASVTAAWNNAVGQ